MSSAIYDPLSRADLPAPRHAVESDDEDDFSSDDEESVTSGELTIASSQDTPRGKDVVVLVDQVGEAIAMRTRLQRTGEVQWRTAAVEKQIASLSSRDEALHVLLSPGSTLRADLPSLTSATRALLQQLQPKSLQVISHYHPSLYIASTSTTQASQNPPIRYLASAPPQPSLIPSTAELFAPPNYLSASVEACMVQEAAYLSIPTVVLLVPATQPPSQAALWSGAALTRNNKGKKKGRKSESSSNLQDEFPSDDEEDQMATTAQDLPDPSIANVLGDEYDLSPVISLLRFSSTGKFSSPDVSAAAFIQTRRQAASKARRDLGGMYA